MRDAVQHPAILVLFRLDGFPVRQHFLTTADFDLAEHVWVAAHELTDDAADHVIWTKRLLTPAELTEEHDLQRQISELFLDMEWVVFVDCVDDLTRLFEDVAPQGFHVLLAIPGAAPFPE